LNFLLGHIAHVNHAGDKLVANGEFWEHLQEHIMLAVACVIIGILIGFIILNRLHNRKFRVDYTLEKGMIMRMPTDCAKSKRKHWIIVNPTTLLQWIDVLVLCVYDRGKDKLVDKQSRKRLRIISIILVIVVAVSGLTAITLILSAFEKSMDIFDYIGK
jgi:hypothetical protein